MAKFWPEKIQIKPHSRRTFLKAGSAVAGAGIAAGIPIRGAAAGTVTSSFDRTLPAFRKPEQLHVADLRNLNGDEQTLFTTLQGRVNKLRPRIYYLLQNDDTDQAWLDTIDVPTINHSDPWEILSAFATDLSGMVVYDPDVPDSVNIATMIAGLSNAVVASPSLVSKLKGDPYRLRIVNDLRGRFTDKLDAYNWALTHLRPKMSDSVLAGIGGMQSQSVPGVTWTVLAQETQQVRDSSNDATYTIDASSLLGGDGVFIKFSDAFTGDGWGPSVEHVTVIADGQTIADFQPTTDGETPYVFDLDGSQIASGGWRFADGGNYFIYKFDPPAGTTSLQLKVHMWNEYVVSGTDTAPTQQVAFPVFRDYIAATDAFVCWLDPLVDAEVALFEKILATYPTDTAYMGWFVGGHEATGVTVCANHSVYVLAADFLTNATVLSGTRASIRTSQPSVPTPKLQNKVYVTLTMSEGDNIQYCEHKLRDLWDDPRRGEVPLNWSINPMLMDLGQVMLAYFQKSQTPNDLFVAGPSGAGYTYPDQWPGTDVDHYTARSGDYMRASGMDIIYALNRHNGDNLPLSKASAQSYVSHIDMPGMLYNWISTSSTTVTAGLPITTQVGVSHASDGVNVLDQATADWDGSSPMFFALGILAWSMGPGDAADLANQLDSSKYEVVRADTFYELMHQTL